MRNQILNSFNSPDTIAVFSPYYSKSKGDFRGYSIARYTNLLTSFCPKNQKIIVFCEAGSIKGQAYLYKENILIVPTYTFDSLSLFSDLKKQIFKFNKVKDYLVQFEFSIFGGKKVLSLIALVLALLKVLGKNTSITLHQVVTNLDELSGHLGMIKHSLKLRLLNKLMNVFYKLCGVLTSKIVVHDQFFKKRLSDFINKEKIVVIPHAIGDQSIRKISSKDKQKARKQFSLSKRDRVVTVYGYRSWYKGTDWVVKAVTEINSANPKIPFKLLVAGGESPTLKETASYKSFDKKLKSEIKRANGYIRTSNFIPEKDVWKVFAASDIVIFPYRSRMSASGAFALTLAYKKPFLVSKNFSEGLGFKVKEAVFDLNTFSFNKAVNNIFKNRKTLGKVYDFSTNYIQNKDWGSIANHYMQEIKSDKLDLYANNFLKKAYQLSQG